MLQRSGSGLRCCGFGFCVITKTLTYLKHSNKQCKATKTKSPWVLPSTIYSITQQLIAG
jgi:hypothetical protein